MATDRTLQSVRDALEEQQIAVYFAAVAVGMLVALTLPGAGALEAVINPALALMLFATFLQVPLAELRQALVNLRFLAALMSANFVVLPLVVALLFQLVPDNPRARRRSAWRLTQQSQDSPVNIHRNSCGS